MMTLKRPHIIAIHILCWLLFFSIPVLFLFTQTQEQALVFSKPWVLLTLLVFPVIFYLHTYFLLPALFFKRRYILYILGITTLLAVVLWLKPYDSLVRKNGPPGNSSMGFRPAPPPQMKNKPPEGMPPDFTRENGPPNGENPGPSVDVISLALTLLVLAISVAYVIIGRWSAAVKRAAAAESFRATAELASLKAQINPHFLFNTLNNIYSLALTKDDNTAQCIMMLSNIMRYVTDEATQEIVPLQNEADCIRDFIELNKLRLGSKMKFNYSIGGELAGKFIAPLLFITFVENVFKYGISNHETSEINIYLVAEKNKVTFFCQNKLLPQAAPGYSTGVGIANAKKRLEYLYPEKHELEIKQDDGYYTIRLSVYS
jgi:two-component system LytT family sensor kinase